MDAAAQRSWVPAPASSWDSPPGRRDSLALPAQGVLLRAQPSRDSQECRGLAWGQGDVEQRVNVPQKAFVLLLLVSSLMLRDFWRHAQPKE